MGWPLVWHEAGFQQVTLSQHPNAYSGPLLTVDDPGHVIGDSGKNFQSNFRVLCWRVQVIRRRTWVAAYEAGSLERASRLEDWGRSDLLHADAAIGGIACDKVAKPAKYG